jgi:hypothetical protein
MIASTADALQSSRRRENVFRARDLFFAGVQDASIFLESAS